MAVRETSPFFSPASRGTEEVLAEELRAMGIAQVEVRRGGVAFGSTLEDGYRACLWSRVASRVLMPLVSFEAEDADAFYDGVRRVDWTEHLDADRTLAVVTAGGRAPSGPPHFLALKTKDAIVDTIRDALGRRPSVDVERPDVRIHLHLAERSVGVSLDLSGEGLHHRGVSRKGAVAPLKENLAAAMLRMAGWPEAWERPLLDPLCGSGTLLIEAAAMALDVAPGLGRGRFAGAGWLGHDAALWQRLVEEARDREATARSRELRIAGSDASPQAIRTAQSRIARSRLTGKIRVGAGELRDARPPWKDAGRIVTNPPYGSRIGEAGELAPLWELLGDVLRRRFPGWTAFVLSGNRALDKRIGLKTASRKPLWNGPIECRLLEIPIRDEPVAGDAGPGWRRDTGVAAPFAKRLAANFKRLGKWARKERLTCFRIYDSDIPEYNLSVDWYDGAARVEEYARPKRIDPKAADRHLAEALRAVPQALGIEGTEVTLRVRERRRKGEQHGRFGDRGRFREVREGDLRFRVNLTDYLDTGLFLDDRLLRRYLREQAQGKDMLNLFAYTCTASLAAAAGGAASTTSVDLSSTYLEWGKANFELNGRPGRQHRFVRRDALRYRDDRRYGLIFLAPPTWSRSRGMEGEFDVQRDHAGLIRRVAGMLAPGGTLVFTTNLRGFELDGAALGGLSVEDVTKAMTPRDFERRPRLKAYRISAAPGAAGASGRGRSARRPVRRSSRG